MSSFKLLEDPEDPSASGSQTSDSDEATAVDAVDRQENNSRPWLQKSNELTEFISHTNGIASSAVDELQANTSEICQGGVERDLGILSKITTTFKNLFK